MGIGMIIGTRCPAEQTELHLYLAAGSSARLRD